MNVLETKYREIFSSYLKPTLETWDFKRYSRDGWVRKKGDTVQSINCSLRRIRGCPDAWLGVGVGVAYESLARFLRQAPDSLGLGNLDPKAPSFMGWLVKKFDPTASDYEWLIDNETEEEDIAGEVRDAIERFGFSFWNKYATLDAAVEVWKLKPVERPRYVGAHVDMYTAAVFHIKGHPKKARQHMESCISELEEQYDARPVRSLWNIIRRRRKFLDFLRCQEAVPQ